MGTLLWGCVLILFDVNIVSGRSVIELLPDFIGYLLILSGTGALLPRCAAFAPARRMARVMSAVSFALYLLCLFGFVSSHTAFGYAYALACSVLPLIQLRLIVTGLLSLEKNCGREMAGRAAANRLKVLSVITCAALVCAAAGILTVPAFIAQAIGNLVFLSGLSTFRSRYRSFHT